VYRLHRAEYEALFGPMPPLDDAARFPAITPEEAGCALADDGRTLICRGRPGDMRDYDGMTPEDQHVVTEVVANVAKAIAAYVRQLRCGESRFDVWLDGDAEALDASEQRGALRGTRRLYRLSFRSQPE
jgi:cytochrome c peroxidase